jgi:hypothetical protein
MGTHCMVFYLANFYLFPYEFDFLKCCLKFNTCAVVLHGISLVQLFVDDVFVPGSPKFESFMYLDEDLFCGSIHPRCLLSCVLNCSSNGFSCNFVH